MLSQFPDERTVSEFSVVKTGMCMLRAVSADVPDMEIMIMPLECSILLETWNGLWWTLFTLHQPFHCHDVI